MQPEKMGGTPCLLSRAQMAHSLTLGWALTLVWKIGVYLSFFHYDCAYCVLKHVSSSGNVCTVSNFSLMFRTLEQGGKSLLCKMIAVQRYKSIGFNLNSFEYTHAPTIKCFNCSLKTRLCSLAFSGIY